MDPRHPELAVKRIDELVKQYKRVEKDMAVATVSNRLAELEREGVLVVQELCLVAPRLHDALMQVSRTRRVALTRTPVEEIRPSTGMTHDFSESVEKPAHKWSSAEKVAEAREHLEQTIANSDVEKTVEKSEPAEEKPKRATKKTTTKKAKK